MKIEIIKQFRLLEVGKQLDRDREWSEDLIKRGFAKSLEVVEEVVYQVTEQDMYDAEAKVKASKSTKKEK